MKKMNFRWVSAVLILIMLAISSVSIFAQEGDNNTTPSSIPAAPEKKNIVLFSDLKLAKNNSPVFYATSPEVVVLVTKDEKMALRIPFASSGGFYHMLNNEDVKNDETKIKEFAFRMEMTFTLPEGLRFEETPTKENTVFTLMKTRNILN